MNVTTYIAEYDQCVTGDLRIEEKVCRRVQENSSSDNYIVRATPTATVRIATPSTVDIITNVVEGQHHLYDKLHQCSLWSGTVAE